MTTRRLAPPTAPPHTAPLTLSAGLSDNHRDRRTVCRNVMGVNTKEEDELVIQKDRDGAQDWLIASPKATLSLNTYFRISAPQTKGRWQWWVPYTQRPGEAAPPSPVRARRIQDPCVTGQTALPQKLQWSPDPSCL